MRILFIVPYMPNQIRVRPFNLIRALSANNHEVTVLTLFQNLEEQLDEAQLKEYCDQVYALPLTRWRSIWNCLRVSPTKTPLQVAFCWQPEGGKTLTRLMHNPNGSPGFDVVHVEHLRGAWYAKQAQNLAQGQIPVIWDSVDCISLLFQLASRHSKRLFGRWWTRLELGRTREFEKHITPTFNRVLVTSEVDKQALAQLAGSDQNIEVLGNGVDLDTFRPAHFELRSPNNLVVSGKMSYHANVTMVLNLVQEIMPRIWRHRPDVSLTIVGKDPVREIQDLAQHPLVTVTGTVPAVTPYLQKAAIAVAPLSYGVGIQNKVLEAMACATPVITTSQVLGSLKTRPNEELMVADHPEAFASAALMLLADENQRRTMGDAGRDYVQAHHNWSAIAARLAEIYQEEINKINGVAPV